MKAISVILWVALVAACIGGVVVNFRIANELQKLNGSLSTVKEKGISGLLGL